MPRDPNVPDAFDVYTLVLLRRPADAPEMSDTELDALQAQHLAYRAQLRQQGVLVVNGPLGDLPRPESISSELATTSVVQCRLGQCQV